LEEHAFASEVRLTVCIGTSSWEPSSGKDFSDSLEEADQWLYRREERRGKAEREEVHPAVAR